MISKIVNGHGYGDEMKILKVPLALDHSAPSGDESIFLAKTMTFCKVLRKGS
jgi:hypothetical protein